MLPLLRSTLILSILLISVLVTAQTPKQETISIRVRQGTHLSFDLSNDGKSIVFDLLGQLWIIPAHGGSARPVTNAVRDVAEDLEPSFSPDGRHVAFRAERNGRMGLWLLHLNTRRVRQLTQLTDPDGFDRDAAWSPDSRVIAFSRAVAPSPPTPGRFAIFLLDVASGTTRELSIPGMTSRFLSDPVWTPDGKQIAFIARKAPNERAGRVWIVSASSGGPATPITTESVQAHAPSFSSNGKRMAYFAPDSNGRTQIWLQELDEAITAKGQPIQGSNHVDVTPTRIRWFRDNSAILYSADGGFWKLNTSDRITQVSAVRKGASGRYTNLTKHSTSAPPLPRPAKVPFIAHLSITRPRLALPQAHFPEPGRQEPAKGFMGLALSPDGRHIAVLALGKLWVIPIGGAPRAVANVPIGALSLAWSPNGDEVAWFAGVAEHEDLFATNLTTGVTRKITSLPGREMYPRYSPNGRHLAFVHVKAEQGALRVIDASANNVTDEGQTLDLKSIKLNWSSAPQWSQESDGLLVFNEATSNQPSSGTFVPLSGQRQTLKRFPDAPISLQWTPQKKLVFVRHDRLWEAPFDLTGILSDPKPMGNAAALYASSSRDGSVLFVSDGGLRLRRPDGTEQKLGWPISYAPPVGERLLIRNVRIIDGRGGPKSAARDILIERGRISRIAPAISVTEARVIDAGGRVVMPGLIDLHAHVYRTDLLPGFLYFGITTIRDQGTAMAPLAAFGDAIAAGVLPGPRVGYGGFQFYSDWAFDEEQGRGIEPEADPEHVKRAVELAQAFGAQHIKTRTFRRWDINAHMVSEAHKRGLRATGHCALQLPLVAASMDAKEHTGFCGDRGQTYIYDDFIQLFRAAGIGVVPTITYVDFAVRLNERPALLDDDVELLPFRPERENFNWMINLPAGVRKKWADGAQLWRESVAKLSRAGVTIGTGTDIWQIPTGVHMELEQLVKAGLSPSKAISAGTGNAARILGADKDLGTIEVGKLADLIILDADPFEDIRNTRKIWQVVHYGRLVDRAEILKVMKPR